MSKGEIIAITIGVFGLIFTGIQAWDILDKRGAMSASIAVSVWVLSLGMVGYAVYKNLRGIYRSESLLAQIQTLKDEFRLQTEAAEKKHAEDLKKVKLSLFEEIQAKYNEPKIDQPQKVTKWNAPFHDNVSGLHIESAIYGSPGRTRDVTDRLRAMLPKGSGDIVVRNYDLCDDDPSENVYKFLTVTVSITQGQDRILAIPELPATATLSIHQVKAAAAAPQLLVEYVPQKLDPLEDEHFVFANEGPGTIKDLKIGPLIWVVRHRREINLHNVVGPLRPQQHIDCKFAAFEQKERMQHISRLTTILREADPDAETEVSISYCDLNGNRFSRKFLLTIDPYDRIAWDPCPVQPESDGGETH
jgi:hypothetical protein